MWIELGLKNMYSTYTEPWWWVGKDKPEWGRKHNLNQNKYRELAGVSGYWWFRKLINLKESKLIKYLKRN